MSTVPHDLKNLLVHLYPRNVSYSGRFKIRDLPGLIRDLAKTCTGNPAMQDKLVRSFDDFINESSKNLQDACRPFENAIQHMEDSDEATRRIDSMVSSALGETMFRTFLAVPHIQGRIIDILLAQLVASENDDAVLLLSQLRFMEHKLEDAESLLDGLVEALDPLSAEIQRDVVSIIPEIALDHVRMSIVVRSLQKIMLTYPQLTIACLDAVTRLGKIDENLQPLVERALSLLNAVQSSDLPVLIRFLFAFAAESDIPNIILQLRKSIGSLCMFSENASALAANHLSASQSSQSVMSQTKRDKQRKSNLVSAHSLTALNSAESSSAGVFSSFSALSASEDPSLQRDLSLWILDSIRAALTLRAGISSVFLKFYQPQKAAGLQNRNHPSSTIELGGDAPARTVEAALLFELPRIPFPYCPLDVWILCLCQATMNGNAAASTVFLRFLIREVQSGALPASLWTAAISTFPAIVRALFPSLLTIAKAFLGAARSRSAAPDVLLFQAATTIYLWLFRHTDGHNLFRHQLSTQWVSHCSSDQSMQVEAVLFVLSKLTPHERMFVRSEIHLIVDVMERLSHECVFLLYIVLLGTDRSFYDESLIIIRKQLSHPLAKYKHFGVIGVCALLDMIGRSTPHSRRTSGRQQQQYSCDARFLVPEGELSETFLHFWTMIEGSSVPLMLLTLYRVSNFFSRRFAQESEGGSPSSFVWAVHPTDFPASSRCSSILSSLLPHPIAHRISTTCVALLTTAFADESHSTRALPSLSQRQQETYSLLSIMVTEHADALSSSINVPALLSTEDTIPIVCLFPHIFQVAAACDVSLRGKSDTFARLLRSRIEIVEFLTDHTVVLAEERSLILTCKYLAIGILRSAFACLSFCKVDLETMFQLVAVLAKLEHEFVHDAWLLPGCFQFSIDSLLRSPCFGPGFSIAPHRLDMTCQLLSKCLSSPTVSLAVSTGFLRTCAPQLEKPSGGPTASGPNSGYNVLFSLTTALCQSLEALSSSDLHFASDMSLHWIRCMSYVGPNWEACTQYVHRLWDESKDAASSILAARCLLRLSHFMFVQCWPFLQTDWGSTLSISETKSFPLDRSTRSAIQSVDSALLSFLTAQFPAFLPTFSDATSLVSVVEHLSFASLIPPNVQKTSESIFILSKRLLNFPWRFTTFSYPPSLYPSLMLAEKYSKPDLSQLQVLEALLEDGKYRETLSSEDDARSVTMHVSSLKPADLAFTLARVFSHAAEPLAETGDIVKQLSEYLENPRGRRDLCALNKNTFPTFFRVTGVAATLALQVLGHGSGMFRSHELVALSKLVALWDGLVNVCKVDQRKSVIQSCIAVGRSFLSCFNSQIFKRLVKTPVQDLSKEIPTIFKSLSIANRTLHALCADSKAMQHADLATAQIPALKRVIEQHIIRVPKFLKQVGFEGHLAISSLKHKNVFGDEVSSQLIAAEDELQAQTGGVDDSGSGSNPNMKVSSKSKGKIAKSVKLELAAGTPESKAGLVSSTCSKTATPRKPGAGASEHSGSTARSNASVAESPLSPISAVKHLARATSGHAGTPGYRNRNCHPTSDRSGSDDHDEDEEDDDDDDDDDDALKWLSNYGRKDMVVSSVGERDGDSKHKRKRGKDHRDGDRRSVAPSVRDSSKRAKPSLLRGGVWKKPRYSVVDEAVEEANGTDDGDEAASPILEDLSDQYDASMLALDDDDDDGDD
eukprot:ANDGO_00621.mRNA.1 Fanconi anemia group D2 protein homolog OS=Rattus norvegicus GN=Fancd2 PE=2 SV=2